MKSSARMNMDVQKTIKESFVCKNEEENVMKFSRIIDTGVGVYET